MHSCWLKIDHHLTECCSFIGWNQGIEYNAYHVFFKIWNKLTVLYFAFIHPDIRHRCSLAYCASLLVPGNCTYGQNVAVFHCHPISTSGKYCHPVMCHCLNSIVVVGPDVCRITSDNSKIQAKDLIFAPLSWKILLRTKGVWQALA